MRNNLTLETIKTQHNNIDDLSTALMICLPDFDYEWMKPLWFHKSETNEANETINIFVFNSHDLETNISITDNYLNELINEGFVKVCIPYSPAPTILTK